ncbi:lyase family protein [Microbacterium pumilum]|uniref:3-carboxy-cis,cis-muconate cycloisomerase n=1 Tax=Microbacterium pumilum TaxID=344165 RepID=A0ABN2RQJ1_9MICO
MPSDDRSFRGGEDAAAPVDAGLLSPVTARTRGAASDDVVLRHLVEAEISLGRALVSVGAAPESILAALNAAADPDWLREIDIPRLAGDAVADGNPMIPLIALLRARVAGEDPDAAAWIHRGATSQDIIDSALMTLGRDVASRIDADLGETIATLALLAERHRADPAAARTLTQHAVPTTIGARVAGWIRALIDARSDLHVVANSLPAQLGGAAGTLAAFVEQFGPDTAAALPALFADELGLAQPRAPWHTERRPVTRLGDALATVVAALGLVATDVATLARTEIGEVSLGAGGGSSAMPHKQNPVDAVLIRSAALRAPGLAAQLHLAAGLAVDERPDGAWHAEWPVLVELLQLTAGAASRGAALTGGLGFDAGRARANLALTGGLIVTERLGIALRPLIGSARFDELVEAAGAGGDLRELVATLPEAADLDVDALLDPAEYLGLAVSLADAAVREAREAE